MLGHDNLFDALCLLLADSKEADLYDELCKELEIIESSSIGREEEHKENIDEVSEIEEKTRTRDKHYRFKRTDIVKCPNCDDNLVFRYKFWVKKELGNKKNTKKIALGCSNFPITGCNVFIKPRKDAGIGFDDIKEIHIEERMGWTMEERHVDSILDNYYELEREVVALKKLLNVESEEVYKRDSQIDTMNNEMQNLRTEIREHERRIQKDEDGNLVLKKGKPVADTSLRDTENVPLKEDIRAYFEREVLPFAPDAWIDEKKSKVGYEIPFIRYFYKYEAPRPSEEIMAEIMGLEKELSGSLEEVFR